MVLPSNTVENSAAVTSAVSRFSQKSIVTSWSRTRPAVMISIRSAGADPADVVALAAAVLLADQNDVGQLGQQRAPTVLGVEERAGSMS